jgi:hypothetical protein
MPKDPPKLIADHVEKFAIHRHDKFLSREREPAAFDFVDVLAIKVLDVRTSGWSEAVFND